MAGPLKCAETPRHFGETEWAAKIPIYFRAATATGSVESSPSISSMETCNMAKLKQQHGASHL